MSERILSKRSMQYDDSQYFRRYIALDAVREQLTRIRIPHKAYSIHKEECCFSFDTPASEGGLYVNLSNFLGMCESYVNEYVTTTGLSAFLLIKRENVRRIDESPKSKKEPGQKGPYEKMMEKMLEVEVGTKDLAVYEFTDTFYIVIMPDKLTIRIPDCELPYPVRMAVAEFSKMEAVTVKMITDVTSGIWPQLKENFVTKFTESLVQKNICDHIPPWGLMCALCNRTGNLWLNLTDGSIHCSEHDPSEHVPTDHAYQYHKETGYPLIVRLDTINDLIHPEVYSFPEKMKAKDALLRMHLRRFGIKLTPVRRAFLTKEEHQLEMFKCYNDWYAICEMGNLRQEVLSGPGYTGLTNLGNTGYLNATIQLLFAIPEFHDYFTGENASEIFADVQPETVFQFAVQMAKLGNGLMSGKYSDKGITPHIFKHTLNKCYPMFEAPLQHDAFEFFERITELVDLHTPINENPFISLKICFEDYFFDDNKNIGGSYNRFNAYCLQVPIPEKLITREQCKSMQDNGIYTKPNGNGNTNRNKVSLYDCLKDYFGTKIIEIHRFEKGIRTTSTSQRKRRIVNMPDFVMIQVKKFVQTDDWRHVKMNVIVETPEILDLTEWRSTSDHEVACDVPFKFNNMLLMKLEELGYSYEACKRACYYTNNKSLEAACIWLKNHIRDSNLNNSFKVPKYATPTSSFRSSNRNDLAVLSRLGFDRHSAKIGLKESDGVVENAAMWLIKNSESLSRRRHSTALDEKYARSSQIPASKRSTLRSFIEPRYRDGLGTYKLRGFVSHIGSRKDVGHNVCHVIKDNKWVLFDDLRVVRSVLPPVKFGYFYLYERIK